MSSNTERDGSGTITVSPANESDQSALVVICHGLGDTSEGFVDVAEKFSRKMPYVKFILPTAPTQPVTLNMGMAMPSWYDIVGLSEKANENCKGIDESRERIESILKAEHDTYGLPYSRMVLMGFSQGGALSLYTGMQLSSSPEEQSDNNEKKKLAGIILLSGYLPSEKSFSVTDGLQDTPILHCHGTQDNVVPYAMAKKTNEVMKAKNGATDYQFESYPIQHTVSIDELNVVQKFLFEKVLPPNDEYKIKLKDPKSMSIKELKAAIRKAGLSSKAIGLCEKSEFIQLVQDHRDGKL